MNKIYPKLVYTWKYTPKDLFQGKHNLKFDQYDVVISEGKITAEVYNSTAKGHHIIIQDHVEHFFRAASITSGLGYAIDKDHSTEAFDENGEKIPGFFMNKATYLYNSFPMRFGVAFSDEEKQQVVEKEKILGEFFAKYYYAKDPIIKFIYESYEASLTEERFPFFLFDIKEAIETFLKSAGFNIKNDAAFCKELNLEKSVWDKIGKLANNENWLSRHRGKHYDKLEKGSASEKAEAMKAAKKMILAFFEKLMANPKLGERLDQK